jgi:hypothetical protein
LKTVKAKWTIDISHLLEVECPHCGEVLKHGDIGVEGGGSFEVETTCLHCDEKFILSVKEG